MEHDSTRDAAEVRLNRLLNLILETAVEAIGFSAATITARHGDEVSTVGATDQRLIGLDDAQYEAGGPCMAALDQSDPIFWEDDAATEQRWEHFGIDPLRWTGTVRRHRPPWWSSSRTQRGFGSRALSDAGGGCTSLRCSRRSPGGRRRGSARSGGR
jgi:hypothetical protein